MGWGCSVLAHVFTGPGWCAEPCGGGTWPEDGREYSASAHPRVCARVDMCAQAETVLTARAQAFVGWLQKPTRHPCLCVFLLRDVYPSLCPLAFNKGARRGQRASLAFLVPDLSVGGEADTLGQWMVS